MDWDFSTALIGSLPHRDSKTAVDMILDGRISVPSWPQLPSLGYSESMYVQTGEHLPGIMVDDEGKRITADLGAYDPTDIYTAIVSGDTDFFAHSEKHHMGLTELLGRDISGYIGVKGQVTGPVSLGLQIQDPDGRSVIYDESYSEIVRKTVNMTAKWQVRELSKKNRNVIIFFDEPSLSLLGSPFASVSPEDAKTWMNEAMDVPGCRKGVHCCGNTDWPTVLSTDVDILSFDAYAYAHTLAMFPKELGEFIERGGVLSWGIVPSSDEGAEIETPENLAGILSGHMESMCGKGISKDRLAHQSLITPQCGLGGMSETNAGRTFTLLSELSAKMKEMFGLG
jgi:hypothetical protein